jgi:phosphotriesterase-related protein
MTVGMVQTVLGPVDPAELGVCDAHEHVFIRGGLPIVLEPEFRLDSLEAAVVELNEYAIAGGGAVVDCMPLGVGRDVDGLADASRRTGVHIIAATGFHKQRYYPADHWIHRYDAETITQLLVDEWRSGMDVGGYDGPLVCRREARPGVIKVATTAPEATTTEHKLVTAAGAAAVATGLPLLTHTDGAGDPAWQLDALVATGLDPGRVILSHVDRHQDLASLVALAERGAWLSLDWLGRRDRRPDSYVADLVVGLAQAGHLGRVLIGQDLARRQYWRAYGGGPGLRNLLDFAALLAKAGLDQDGVNAVLTINPQRAYACAEPGV